MVGEDVRQIEREIDACIRAMTLWGVRRDVLLHRLLGIWRDILELAHLRFAHASLFQIQGSASAGLAMEARSVAGVFQALKWAMELAPAGGSSEVSDENLVDLVMTIGPGYQLLVDALKLGAHGKVDFTVDPAVRTLTIYEGGNQTGHDASIVRKDHTSVSFHRQRPLVDDADQLTSRWNAGAYRQYWRWLRPIADGAETETIVGQAGPLAPQQELLKRPVVVEIPAPPPELLAVQKDLTLTIGKMQSGLKWKIDSWHDCPLVQIGDRDFGISRALLTLATQDDYMLRVAALNDRDQYERVSGLREGRMIAQSESAFRRGGWAFTPHCRLADPPRQIDGYATRGAEVVVVQLKSTLRPQSPWEVHKRNEDVIAGISHTAEVVSRIGGDAIGIVVTDGYEGDYATWAESLRTNVPVATLEDLDWIVKSPRRAFQILAERAGIRGAPSEEMPERTVTLCGWTLRAVDKAKP
jgi:hypothetical protein